MGGCGEGGDEVPEMGWTREIVANVGNPQVSAGPLFPSRSEAYPGASSSCTATRGVPRVNDVPHNQLEDITSSSPQAAHRRLSYTSATFLFFCFILLSSVQLHLRFSDLASCLISISEKTIHLETSSNSISCINIRIIGVIQYCVLMRERMIYCRQTHGTSVVA